MRNIIICISLLIISCAGSSTGPIPIPKDRQEEISRVMLTFQNAQLTRIKMEQKMQADLQQQDRVIAYEQKNYFDALARYQKEFHAENCELNLDKTWKCPDKPQAQAPKGKE